MDCMHGLGRRGMWVGVAALLMATGTAVGAPSDDGALQGPKVQKREAGAPTLVKRSMTGEMEQLETRPEIAALEKLSLSADEKAKTQAIIDARAVKVHDFLAANLLALNELRGARESGAKPQEMMPKVRAMHDAARDAGLLDPTFAEQLSGVLSTENAAKLNGLVDDYIREMGPEPGGPGGRRGRGGPEGRGGPDGGEKPTDGDRGGKRRHHEPRGDDEMQDQGPGPDGPGPGGPDGPGAHDGPNGGMPPPPPPEMMRQRAEMQLLLREVGRDFKSTIAEQKDRTEKLLRALDLSADQEAKIRAIIREQGEKNGIKPTPQGRRAMWDKIMSELTDAQKAKARQLRRQGR